MLIKLVCDGCNHPCLIFDPIRLPSPGGKDNISNVQRGCHHVVSPTSLNSKQCGRRLALFCQLALDGVESYHRPILINQKRRTISIGPSLRSFQRLHSLLIKHSNTMNYWSQADAGNAMCWLRRTNLLFFVGLYMLAPNRFFFCVHSMEVGSSCSQISLWGNGKMAETHAEATPIFCYSPQKEKLWHGQWRKCDIFCAVIPLYLQIDALSEIVRRRRNECALVTQRHTTGTSGDLCSAAAGSLWKHRNLFMLFKCREGVRLSDSK